MRVRVGHRGSELDRVGQRGLELDRADLSSLQLECPLWLPGQKVTSVDR